MYSRKLALVVLAGGLLSSLPLMAQRAKRNTPLNRPKTTGANIIPNGGFELPQGINLPTKPNIPKDYPQACLPTSSSDVFGSANGSDESIFVKLQNYAEDNGLEETLTDEKIASFQNFVEQYIAYLKKLEPFSQGSIQGWWMYPRKKDLTSNAFSRTTEGHSGLAGLKVEGNFPVEQQIYVYPDPITVNSKAKYLVSFFFRGNLPKDDGGYPKRAQKMAYVKLRWQPKAGTALMLNGKAVAKEGSSWEDKRDNTNKFILNNEGFKNQLLGLDFSKDPTEWQEVWMEVDAPENAASVILELAFPGFADGAISNYKVEIDDVSMTLIEGHEGESSAPKLTTPEAPKKVAQRYTQREFTAEWAASTEDVDSYEVEISERQGRNLINAKTYTTKVTRYAFEGLEPGKSYQVRLRTIKGTAKSEYSKPLDVATRSLGGFTGGEIPFLYTINEDGSCSQKLALYYLELSNPKAKFTYYIDDNEVKPEGNTLTFPSLGEHSLHITIEEAPDKIWELDYQLNVK